ncbi:MAG: PaaX family transcriptional regulator C-terminal domain-containing protein [Actinomycetota bacterium]
MDGTGGGEQPLPRSLAPLLGASRRDGGEQPESTRGRLLTLLGEFVLPAGGSVWTRTLVLALGSLGVSEHAARQAIARSEDRGWLGRSRHGRRTRWSLTDEMTSLLSAGAERIYTFGRIDRPWPGTWLLLWASVHEADRRTRTRLTTELSWAGFGTAGSGTWITPWVDREDEVVRLVGELGVEARTFRAELGELGAPDELAQQAWDLPVLAERYRSFLDDTAHEGHTDGLDAVRELAAAVHRWRHFPFLDPELPAALLPEQWPGRAAAERFAAVRGRLLEPATAWWVTTESGRGAD